MPKQKITKEMVVDAAFQIARKEGMEQVLVKNIADTLGCSVQPIYSYCKNMDGLRKDVEQRTRAFVHQYLAEHMDKEHPFQSSGKAHIQLAQEEPHLLRIFTLQQQEDISSLEDLYDRETNPSMAQSIADSLHISIEKARQLHLHMLIYTIGISTIYAITTPGIPAADIFAQQEQAYQAFLKDAKEDSI